MSAGGAGRGVEASVIDGEAPARPRVGVDPTIDLQRVAAPIAAMDGRDPIRVRGARCRGEAVSAAAIERVVSGAAVNDLHVLGAERRVIAEDQVIAVAAQERIRAAFAEQRVVAVAATDEVVQRVADDEVFDRVSSAVHGAA